jgi:hypothetical protein
MIITRRSIGIVTTGVTFSSKLLGGTRLIGIETDKVSIYKFHGHQQIIPEVEL